MKTLIALDGSLHAEKILNMVAKKYWPPQSEIRVVIVVGKRSQWDEQEQYLRQCTVILDSRLDSLKKKLKGMKISGVVLEGKASQEILKEAKQWQAEKIIIGSHGDTGIRPDDVNSVAAEIVNESPCSVEVMKLQKEAVQSNN